MLPFEDLLIGATAMHEWFRYRHQKRTALRDDSGPYSEDALAIGRAGTPFVQ